MKRNIANVLIDGRPDNGEKSEKISATVTTYHYDRLQLPLQNCRQVITISDPICKYISNMVFHLPSAIVGSALAGSGFLLIHRELSHRRRLTTKWVVQEYAEEQWKEWRKQVAEDAIISESSKVIITLDS